MLKDDGRLVRSGRTGWGGSHFDSDMQVASEETRRDNKFVLDCRHRESKDENQLIVGGWRNPLADLIMQGGDGI